MNQNIRIAAVYCIYNEEEYLEYSVRSVLPSMEAIILCLGKGPYTAYQSGRNGDFPADKTPQIVKQLAKEFPDKIHVISEQWADQIQHREAGLKRCLELGMDYYFLIDGDEVYKKEHLDKIRKTLAEKPDVGTFIIKCHTFWRSFKYMIPAQINTWRPHRLFKLTTKRQILGIPFPHHLKFVGCNDLNSIGEEYEFPPEEVVFYHFSYARSPKRMLEKLTTFPHAQEILKGWIDSVWTVWPHNRNMENIHPTDPPKFPKADKHPLEELPESMQKHPYYAQDIIH